MNVYYGRGFKAKCYNIRLIYLCMTILLVIERGEFPYFFGRKIFRYWIGQETSPDINPLTKCMLYSEAESQANAPQVTRPSRKKNFISMGECYTTRILREISYVNARQNSRSNQKPRSSYQILGISNFLLYLFWFRRFD